MGDLSKNFSSHEFACKHCGKLELDPRLVPALQELRDLIGPKQIHINSGYRCDNHPESVKRRKNNQHPSRHQHGQAVDIWVDNLDIFKCYVLADQIDAFCNGGIGLYDGGFLHLDVRKGRARWSVVNNAYLPIYKVVVK